jgi:RND family efflux transporter MFP subunit
MSLSSPLRRLLPARVSALIRRIVFRSYITGLIGSLALGSGYMVWAQNSTSTTAAAKTTMTMVTRQTITSAIKAQGKVTFANEQELKFNQKGTVAVVNSKEGDAVKKGQVIAQLDKTSALADVRQAQLSISASQLQLKQLQADTNNQVISAQNALNDSERQFQQAQNDLAVAQEKLPSDLATAQRAVTEKQSALVQAQLNLKKQKDTEVQGLAMTAQSVLTTSDELLDTFYGILTRDQAARPSGTSSTDLEIDPLLYNDFTIKQEVENAYSTAVNTSATMHASYGATLVTERDPSRLLQALSDAQTMAQAVYQLSEDTYSLLQGATTDTTKFTSSDLTAARSNVSNNRSKAADLIGQVQTAEANLAAISSDGGVPSITLKAAQDAVTSAQNGLTEAQDSLRIMQTQNPADLQQQQQALTKVQEDYQAKQAALTGTNTSNDVNGALKQNTISQQVTSLQKAEKALSDYDLVAPFDGVIRHIDYKVGDNLLDTGDTEFVTLENPDVVVVTIPLDQLDVVNVHTGMAATINFDAVPGQTFDGAIQEINSTPVEQSGVVSYNVLIQLPTPKGLTLLSGMTATVNIETSSKANVLAVPNLALKHTGSRTTVQKADGTTAVVQTGVTNGQYTEITSGLTEGDSVMSVNVTITSSTSTNANAAQQLLRGGAAGGGFGGAAGGGTFRGTGGGRAN